jgi:PAS domain S-box-containing protein
MMAARTTTGNSVIIYADGSKHAPKVSAEFLQFEGLAVAVQSLNEQGIITRVNTSWTNLFGIRAEDAIGMRFVELLSPNSTASFEEAFSRLVSGSAPHVLELAAKRKDGSTLTVLASSSAQFDASGAFRSTTDILQDITKMTQALADSETRYHNLFDEAVVGIFRWNLEGRIIDANLAFAQMMGYESPQAMLRMVSDVSMIYLKPEQRQEIMELAKQRGGAVLGLEVKLRRRDGSFFTASINTRRIKAAKAGAEHFDAFVEDISDRKLLQEVLRESEEKFKGIFEESPIGLGIYDSQGRLIGINKSAVAIFGMADSSDAIGIRLFQDWGLTEEQMLKLRENQAIHYETTFDFGKVTSEGIFKTNKTGTILLEVFVKPVLVEGASKPTGYLAQVQDITQRRQMIESLNKTQTQQKAILDNIPDMAWLKDVEGRFVQVNEPFAKACGLRTQDLPGRSDLDIWPTELAQRYRSDDQEVMSSRKRKRVEEPLADKEGRIQWIETIKTPICDDSGKLIGTTGIARDITERKHFEQRLEENRQRYRNLFDTMASGVVYQDAQGAIVDANPAAQRILGLTIDEMSKRTSHDTRWRAIHEDGSDYPGNEHPSMLALATGNQQKNVIMGVYNPKEEEYRWICIDAIPMFLQNEKTPYQVYATFSDITASKMAKDELVRVRLDLQAQIASLKGEIEQAKEGSKTQPEREKHLPPQQTRLE